MSKLVRRCPLCNSRNSKLSFPFVINFDGGRYFYYRCAVCATVFVNPIPSDAAFSRMYANSNYHDVFYSDPSIHAYDRSAKVLCRFAQSGSSVLDYGCGTGTFLNALQRHGFRAVGVEFSSEVVSVAHKNSRCRVYQKDEFFSQLQASKFDIIYLGDVLEHLRDPEGTLVTLLTQLKNGGLLMVEGPLENNHSPVYWASFIFGSVKRLLLPKFIGNGVPTHLFRTSAKAQKDFLRRVCPGAQFLLWDIYETGWPYTDGTLFKRGISSFAKIIGGRSIRDMTFGNRFRAILSISRA